MKTWKLVLVCAAVAVFGAVALGKLPHTLRGGRVAGHVVDATTGQPIAGVHVGLIWEAPVNPSGFTGHNSRTICYHAAATMTDPAGRFEIPPWRKWSTYDVDQYGAVALVYTRDYVPRQISLKRNLNQPQVERSNERFALQLFNGSVTERIEALFFGLANQGCDYGKDSKTSLYPMLKAIFTEAREIAGTDRQRGTVRIIAEFAADAALATNPNGPANDARNNAFIEEHLK